MGLAHLTAGWRPVHCASPLGPRDLLLCLGGKPAMHLLGPRQPNLPTPQPINDKANMMVIINLLLAVESAQTQISNTKHRLGSGTATSEN